MLHISVKISMMKYNDCSKIIQYKDPYTQCVVFLLHNPIKSNVLNTLKKVSWKGVQMSLEGVPLLLRPGRGKEDLLWGCVRRLVRLVKGSIKELLSVTLTSHSLTFSPRAHCCAASWSTCRRSRRSHLFPNTITITCAHKHHQKCSGGHKCK